MVRIIQLSDIHLSKDNINNLGNIYLNPLIKDISNFNNENKIDFIIICGDLVDKSGKSLSTDGKSSFKIFIEKFITPIENVLQIGFEKYIFNIGNHDINEDAIEDISEAGAKDKFKSVDKINEYIDKHRINYTDLIRRIENFKEFEKDYYNGYSNKLLSNFESCFYFEIENKNIGIVSLNSAWRYSRSSTSCDVIMGSSQVKNACDFFKKNNCIFNIAISHYTIDSLSDIEKSEINNLFQSSTINILLSGHSHECLTQNISGNYGNIFISKSRSSFNKIDEEKSNYSPGFIVLDIFDDKVKCNYRKYYNKRNVFDKDLDVCDNGEKEYYFPEDKDKKKFNDYLKIVRKNYESNIGIIDESLVISKTDSIAPKSLKKLFVLPKISDSPHTISIQNNKYYSIEDVINYKNNILLVGPKEIGKTTLLNEIFIEISTNFEKYQLIPAKCDYKELIKGNIKTIIARNINESMQDSEILVNQGKVILLIDNYIDIEDSNYNLAKINLKEYLDSHSKLKIVGTTSSDVDLLLSSQDTFINKYFKPLFIGFVGIPEFKNLAIKWFNNNSPDWIHNNINKLIKTFEILRIPHNFFSISLFLWIIEKQENFKPTNNANLIYSFLNYILEGLKIDNTKAGAYNFGKKIDLLTEISFEMYKNGDPSNNYCIEETKLISFIQNLFNSNQRTWSPIEKLNEFIEKGIFITSNNKIQFRFETFYQYFLSLNIDKNEIFKKTVFSDDYFLSFVDELDYYTARKQNDIETLKFSMEHLLKSFEDIDRVFNKNLDDYFPNDSFFLDSINETALSSTIKKPKLNDEQIENELNKHFEMLPVDESIKVKEKISYKNNFHKVLELTARVLKNSENIQNPDLINEYLDIIINKTAKYGIYIQSLFLKYYHQDKNSTFPVPLEFIVFLAPLINQLMLLTWLGTDFIEIPLKKKIESILNGHSKQIISQFEFYLTLFLYSDMKFKGYYDFIDKFIDKINNKYISELFFMKLFLYYMFKSSNSGSLTLLENLMKKTYAKSKNINKKKTHKIIDRIMQNKKKKDVKNLFD